MKVEEMPHEGSPPCCSDHALYFSLAHSSRTGRFASAPCLGGWVVGGGGGMPCRRSKCAG